MKTRTLILASLLGATLVTFACTVPAWVNTVEAEAQVAVPIAGSLVDVIDPALAPAVTLIENGFNALVNTLNTFKASPTATNLQAVQAAFAAVDANVAQLESAAQFKDPATDAKVTAIVQLLAQAVVEIAAQIPAPAASSSAVSAPAATTLTQGQAKGLKAKDLKKQFNVITKGDARFKQFKLAPLGL